MRADSNDFGFSLILFAVEVTVFSFLLSLFVQSNKLQELKPQQKRRLGNRNILYTDHRP